MQYIIMFLMCVIAAIADVMTGLFKARITTGYDSTIMRKGLYGKATNLVVMAFAIAAQTGLEMIAENFAAANPKSPLANVLAKRLKKIQNREDKEEK